MLTLCAECANAAFRGADGGQLLDAIEPAGALLAAITAYNGQLHMFVTVIPSNKYKEWAAARMAQLLPMLTPFMEPAAAASVSFGNLGDPNDLRNLRALLSNDKFRNLGGLLSKLKPPLRELHPNDAGQQDRLHKLQETLRLLAVQLLHFGEALYRVVNSICLLYTSPSPRD